MVTTRLGVSPKRETPLEKLPSDENVFPVAWYPVAWSKELKDKPIKRRLVGRDFVLYRDGRGQVRCLEAYCAHRGADLSLGKCSNGRLQCAYHGWEFAASGMCEHIPAHPDRPVPDFARVRAYPVREEAQLIWVYPSELPAAAVPVLSVFPELNDTRFVLAPYEEEWQAHLTRVVESVLDVAHLAFVHKKTIGRRVPAEIKELKFEAKGSPDVISIHNGGGLLEYRFPQQWMLRPSNPGAAKFINYVVFSPIDSAHTKIFGFAGRTFATHVPGLNRIFSYYSRKILREDQAVVESQHPRPIPEALRMEAHVPADAPQVRFRQRWFDFLTGDEPKVVL
ncbi:aromatic ring-hydroxylating dioxygenase subunit alpha [Alicyclobacillus mengziensis]|uniref:Aromatic ring-hydroxylating dioxygenase subunit alpha n=1 Tax=Alicyclobacillus mengziensis TaxID=2931921 RepID=A0A9X7VZ93_9BACL|nr:aromatic ring-hydroxylating dioxygenase subunit alpha [Alicyclobacillus mengziensis]QSO47444.1 aromatic ring-hydroxylating dioxygenase subunit alpha [Alicyclobacillus mengziensis]